MIGLEPTAKQPGPRWRWIRQAVDRLTTTRSRWSSAGPQLDAADITLFERLRWIAEQEAGEVLWDGSTGWARSTATTTR